MKDFDEFGDNKNRIEELENAIRKRNELIYAMMYSLSHNYQAFMIKPMGVEELYDMFKVEELVEKNKDRKFFINKMEQLEKDIK